METTKDNPIDIPERNIDPNMDEVRPLDDTPEETKNKHKPRIPKNHLISDIIANVNGCVVTRRQSRLNEMGLVCYTS